MDQCLACGGKYQYLGQRSKYRILRCPRCGLGHTDKSKKQNRSYHRDSTYIQEEALFRNIFQKRVGLINQVVGPGRVLEVGCSVGLMLSMLRDSGWQVEGVEISPEAAKVAKARGIRVQTVTFERAKFIGKFDLIIFNHTLEHLADPRLALKKAARLLKSGGVLYIDLPNFGSLSARRQGINWPLLLPEEHPWHFTLKALETVLTEIGFEIVKVDRSSGIWDFADPVSELIDSLVGFKKRFFREILTAIPSWIVSKLDLGSGLIIVARRVK